MVTTVDGRFLECGKGEVKGDILLVELHIVSAYG